MQEADMSVSSILQNTAAVLIWAVAQAPRGLPTVTAQSCRVASWTKATCQELRSTAEHTGTGTRPQLPTAGGDNYTGCQHTSRIQASLQKLLKELLLAFAAMKGNLLHR